MPIGLLALFFRHIQASIDILARIPSKMTWSGGTITYVRYHLPAVFFTLQHVSLFYSNMLYTTK
jgi:hypothetical protein